MTTSSVSSSKQQKDNTSNRPTSIQVAHIGNSIQYYNDCPRLLEHMLKQHFNEGVTQDSCFRGGATLVSLLEKGNGMRNTFATPNALQEDGSYDIGAPTVAALLTETNTHWDFVVLNDHTQSPAREETKKQTLAALQEQYLPLLILLGNNTNTNATVVFIQTAAYRKPVNGADDLGSFDEFTERLHQGYLDYMKVFPKAKLAPVGLAYQYVKKHSDCDGEDNLWEKLYAQDDFHPSPHGTFLEASVLYCTIVGEQPPVYDGAWWETARYMQPPETEPLPLPTEEDAKRLTDVACKVCGIATTDTEQNKVSRL